MQLTLDWTLIQLAFIIAVAIVGFRVGWKYMAMWTIGVFFSTLVAGRLGPMLEPLTNKMISVIAQFVAIGAGKDESTVSAPEISITEVWQPIAVAVLFLLLVALSGWIANKLGNSVDVGLLGKLLGAVFAALGTVLVLGQITGYYQQYVVANGSDPLATNLALSIPTLTLGFNGSPDSSPWTGLGSLAIALFLMLLVIYTIWRVVRKAIF